MIGRRGFLMGLLAGPVAAKAAVAPEPLWYGRSAACVGVMADTIAELPITVVDTVGGYLVPTRLAGYVSDQLRDRLMTIQEARDLEELAAPGVGEPLGLL